MPKIQRTGLPPALRQHLFDRLEERKITAECLYKLKLWRESEPDASCNLTTGKERGAAFRRRLAAHQLAYSPTSCSSSESTRYL